MSLTTKQKFQLKKLIKELATHRGRHTELVTVYIPQGYDLNKIINHLNQEQGTATNIKSSGTRKNVIDALERMIQHLRLFKKTPNNGLAVFSGNVSKKEGQSDVQVWSIEPPVPLKTRIYRCDKQFVLNGLEDMCETKEVYGLIVMDRREGDIALLKGKAIIPLVQTRSNVPGKTRAGGQSAQRFERLREGAAKDFYKKIGELAKDEFLNKKELKGILVGGPGPTKYDFVDGNFITNQVKQKIIAIKDLSYTGDFGIRELVERSKDVLAEEEIAKEKKLMDNFFEKLAKEPGKIAYGEKEVNNALKMGAVDILLISEALEEEKIEEFEQIANDLKSNVEIISTETKEGVQLTNLGKIAAILRYKLQ
ncbi:peptide chain release factor aRF-1 [Candidatus Woesearchaeota archaeon]|nr:peptide chain release factor aRF-1 [Candidatus Woesearchaeota archaeon]